MRDVYQFLTISSLGGGLALIFLGVTQALKLKLTLSATDNQASLRRSMLPFGERGVVGQLLMALIILVWGISAALWLWF